MADIPNVDSGPVHMGDFPLEAYQQYEESQSVTPLSSASGSEVAFRSSVAADSAILDEFAKIASRHTKVVSTFVDRPHDLSLATLFLPNAIAGAFTHAKSMRERLESFLATPNGQAANISGTKLKEFLDQIVELNTLCEVVHTQMSRIGKG